QPFMAWKAKSPHLDHLQTLEQTQYDSLEAIRERQLAALRHIVRHAGQTVPYYRQQWTETGLRPDAVRTLHDLGQFPILTKADIRAHADGLRSEAYRHAGVFPKTTSG